MPRFRVAEARFALERRRGRVEGVGSVRTALKDPLNACEKCVVALVGTWALANASDRTVSAAWICSGVAIGPATCEFNARPWLMSVPWLARNPGKGRRDALRARSGARGGINPRRKDRQRAAVQARVIERGGPRELHVLDRRPRPRVERGYGRPRRVHVAEPAGAIAAREVDVRHVMRVADPREVVAAMVVVPIAIAIAEEDDGTNVYHHGRCRRRGRRRRRCGSRSRTDHCRRNSRCRDRNRAAAAPSRRRCRRRIAASSPSPGPTCSREPRPSRSSPGSSSARSGRWPN